MYKVVFLPAVLDDLLEITRYIAHKLSAPQAARDFVKAVDKTVDVIAKFPYSCKLYLTKRPLAAEVRCAPIANYLLFYTVEKQTVEILHIRYGKREPLILDIELFR